MIYNNDISIVQRMSFWQILKIGIEFVNRITKQLKAYKELKF